MIITATDPVFGSHIFCYDQNGDSIPLLVSVDTDTKQGIQFDKDPKGGLIWDHTDPTKFRTINVTVHRIEIHMPPDTVHHQHLRSQMEVTAQQNDILDLLVEQETK